MSTFEINRAKDVLGIAFGRTSNQSLIVVACAATLPVLVVGAIELQEVVDYLFGNVLRIGRIRRFSGNFVGNLAVVVLVGLLLSQLLS